MESDEGSQPPPAAGVAKDTKAEYRRHLPHLQAARKTLFVTFSTRRRWNLPESVRQQVLEHCLHDHELKLFMHAAVVMPNHVHLLFTPLGDGDGVAYGMAEIMSGIKGASAHSVNRLLARKGAVWESESFDRLLREDEDRRSVAEYICANPVRAGLCGSEDEYPWLSREWAEGQG